MAPRKTRSSKKTSNTEVQEISPTVFASKDADSYRLFILPQNVSQHSQIISLPRGTNKAQARYLFCPDTGLYEYTRLSAPAGSFRSWMISKSGLKGAGEEPSATNADSRLKDVEETDHCDLEEGYIQNNADLHLATPFDPLFLSISLFSVKDSEKAMFRLVDDYIDELCKDCKQIESLLGNITFRRKFEERFGKVCQIRDLGEDKAYKPDLDLLIRELLAKAGRIISSGWAKSMEIPLVQKPLEVPLTNTEASMAELLEREEKEDRAEKQRREGEEDDITLEKRPSSAAIPEALVRLQRVHVVLQYILSSYFPLDMRQKLSEMLSTQTIVDFKPLHEHKARVQEVREALHALRSVSENITRKRNIAETDEQAEERAESKRRKEEEEKKAKAEPRAIKQLKKVNTSGMKKLSSFFTKAPAGG